MYIYVIFLMLLTVITCRSHIKCQYLLHDLYLTKKCLFMHPAVISLVIKNNLKVCNKVGGSSVVAQW
jgi:hypothetical protein